MLKETFSEYETIDSYYICMFTNTVHACKLCNEPININPGGGGGDLTKDLGQMLAGGALIKCFKTDAPRG